MDFLYRFTSATAQAASKDPQQRTVGWLALRARLAAMDPIAFESAQSWWNMITDQVSMAPATTD